MSATKAKASDANFSGVLVPALTPFVPGSLAVDRTKFVAYAKWLLDGGAGGLAVFGTNSEANSQSLGERKETLEAMIEAGVPAKKLMPGTGACALPDAVEATNHAVGLGVGGVLVLPPWYYKGISDDGVYASIAELIDRVGSSDLKVYLYHFPGVSQVPFNHEVIARLMKSYPGTIKGIKDSTGDWDHTKSLLTNFPELETFPGTDYLMFEAMELGAAGCISATANVNTPMIADLYSSFGTAEAKDKDRNVKAVRKALQGFPMISAMKAMLAHYTDDESWRILRPPLPTYSANKGSEVITAMEAAGYRWPGGLEV